MINLTRQEFPYRQRDLSAEVAAAGADDMEPLLAVVATHPLPADAHIGPTEQPDPNCVNAPIWLGLLEAHHRGYLTTDQMRQCLIAGAPGLVDELS